MTVKKRFYMVAVILVVILVGCLYGHLRAGFTDVSDTRLLNVLLGNGSEAENLTVFDFRMVRILYEGSPYDVFNNDMLCDVFGIDSTIMNDPRTNRPFSIPYSVKANLEIPAPRDPLAEPLAGIPVCAVSNVSGESTVSGDSDASTHIRGGAPLQVPGGLSAQGSQEV